MGNRRILRIIIITIIVLLFCPLSMRWIDLPLTLAIHEHAGRAVDFFYGFTWLFDHLFLGFLFYKLELSIRSLSLFLALRYGILVLGFGLFKYVFKRYRMARACLYAIIVHACTSAAVLVVRLLINRERPEMMLTGKPYDLDLLNGEGTSFPSGHASDSFGLLMPFAVAFPRYRFVLLIVPVIISVGRLFLKKHYLSDVVFSTYLALLFCMLWINFINPKKESVKD